MQLKFVENKVVGISKKPPAGYLELARTGSGRCLFCGHMPETIAGSTMCCICRDCICCTPEGERQHATGT